jgi:hypothetical protein
VEDDLQALSTLVNTKLNKTKYTTLMATVGSKANSTDLAKYATKSNFTQLSLAVGSKANLVYVDERDNFIDDRLIILEDQNLNSRLTSLSGTKADKTYVDNELISKANKTYVDTQDVAIKDRVTVLENNPVSQTIIPYNSGTIAESLSFDRFIGLHALFIESKHAEIPSSMSGSAVRFVYNFFDFDIESEDVIRLKINIANKDTSLDIPDKFAVRTIDRNSPAYNFTNKTCSGILTINKPVGIEDLISVQVISEKGSDTSSKFILRGSLLLSSRAPIPDLDDPYIANEDENTPTDGI